MTAAGRRRFRRAATYTRMPGRPVGPGSVLTDDAAESWISLGPVAIAVVRQVVLRYEGRAALGRADSACGRNLGTPSGITRPHPAEHLGAMHDKPPSELEHPDG